MRRSTALLWPCGRTACTSDALERVEQQHVEQSDPGRLRTPERIEPEQGGAIAHLFERRGGILAFGIGSRCAGDTMTRLRTKSVYQY